MEADGGNPLDYAIHRPPIRASEGGSGGTMWGRARDRQLFLEAHDKFAPEEEQISQVNK